MTIWQQCESFVVIRNSDNAFVISTYGESVLNSPFILWTRPDCACLSRILRRLQSLLQSRLESLESDVIVELSHLVKHRHSLLLNIRWNLFNSGQAMLPKLLHGDLCLDQDSSSGPNGIKYARQLPKNKALVSFVGVANTYLSCGDVLVNSTFTLNEN